MKNNFSLERIRSGLAVFPLMCTLVVTGCAPPGPPEPTVVAMPKPGENFALFQQHDTTCRQYAAARTNGQSPQQAAAKSGVAGAAVGTGVGAAAGALIGSASGHAGNGAAVGAGTGLLFGSLMGAAHGQGAAASVQQSYDTAYAQCMVANGEAIEPPPPTVVYAAPVEPVYVPAPAPVYVAPPPVVVVHAPPP